MWYVRCYSSCLGVLGCILELVVRWKKKRSLFAGKNVAQLVVRSVVRILRVTLDFRADKNNSIGHSGVWKNSAWPKDNKYWTDRKTNHMETLGSVSRNVFGFSFSSVSDMNHSYSEYYKVLHIYSSRVRAYFFLYLSLDSNDVWKDAQVWTIIPSSSV